MGTSEMKRSRRLAASGAPRFRAGLLREPASAGYCGRAARGNRAPKFSPFASGAVEAIAGGAGPLGLAAKLANSIGRSNTLQKTYAPVDIEAVRDTDDARIRGPAPDQGRERTRGICINPAARRCINFQAGRC
jgi:hypothetical protein